ncbi:MAG: CxxC-x17-CxxC domain-containing protein [Candidatus Levyibacteriota bacterium]
MGSFNRRTANGGRGRGVKGGFNRGPREMFQTICSKCGKECEVPFRPTGEKPVYCRDCFREMGGGERRGERRFDRPREEQQHQHPENNVSKEEFARLNQKVDKILHILESAISHDDTPEDVIEKVEVNKPEKIVEEVTPKTTPAKKKRVSKKNL